MNIKCQKDILKYVSEKQLKERNAIMEKWDLTRTISKTNGEKMLSFDQKTRVCNSCGKTFKEAMNWRIIKAPDKNGNDVDCGLAPCCFDCEMKEILREGSMGLLG